MKYTPLEETQLIQAYQDNPDTEALSIKFARSKKSVIAKLVQLGVYEPQAHKACEIRKLTKAELVRDIQNISTDLSTLEKASREALLAVHSALGAP